MAGYLIYFKDDIENVPDLKNFFTNNATGEFYKEGEICKNPELAKTLTKLALSNDPIKLFYNGEIAQQMAAEISTNGGYLTKEDLAQYRSNVDENPIENFDFSEDYVMCGPKPPSGFAVTQFIVNVMSRSDPETLFKDDIYYHRFIEAQKYGYAQRTLLGDLPFYPDAKKILQRLTNQTYINEIAAKIKASATSLNPSEYGQEFDQPGKRGTSHTSVIDALGNAISITSSINMIYGARRRSSTLGIFYNNQMDDFSIPRKLNFFGFEAFKSNYIVPRKRPLSSMSPILIYNKHTREIQASLGAAGGSRIISALAQFLIQKFSFNQTVKESIDFPRFHNQFTPFITSYEKGFPDVLVQSLQNRGQNMSLWKSFLATIQAIVRNPDGTLSASNDHRRSIYMNPAGY
uniref:Uncharacterized protein n=1 Tax=Panagrolaimus davidi TaxID=227884 RepID=A0A914QWK2_9BILA